MTRMEGIRARCEAATPGKWFHGRDADIRTEGETIAGLLNTRQDAEFISSAREDVPWLLGEVERLRAELEAAKRDSVYRKGTALTPIHTVGGHGHYDDDDEDFWCPICRVHLGTHRGYEAQCHRCGQIINPDSEQIYEYREMRRNEQEWRGLCAENGGATHE